MSGPLGPAGGSSTNELTAARRALIERKLRERGITGAVSGQSIQRRSEKGPAPLSLNQEGIWFIDQLDPGRPAYNIPGVVRIRGPLARTALESSLERLIRRHEALRTVFELSDEGVPVQIVREPDAFHLPLDDLGHLTPAQQEAEVARRAREDAATPFDLARGPLFTGFLLRLGADHHALVLKVHHLVIDGWSWGILTEELRHLYRSLRRGNAVILPEPELQYADFAVWQRRWLTGDTYERMVGYWTRKLRDLRTLELPTDHRRPELQTFEGMHRPLGIDETSSGQLKAFAHRHGHTLFVVLLSAFKILLRRYCRQDDIVVGATFANRDRKELESTVGYFVTLLPLRTRVTGDLQVAQVMQRVSETTSEAIAHQALPLTRLVKEVGLTPDPSRTPLFQVVFYLLTPDHNPAVFGFGLPGTTQVVQLDDLELTPIETECGLSRFDLMFLLWDLPEGLFGTVEYSTDLFDESTIESMITAFKELLPLLVERGEATVDDVDSALTRTLDEQRRQAARSSKKRMLESLDQIRARNRSSGDNEVPGRKDSELRHLEPETDEGLG